MLAATTLAVAASPRHVRATASASSTTARTTRVGAPVARQLRGGDGAAVDLHAASSRVTSTPPARRNHACNQRRRKISSTFAPRAFAPAAGDLNVSLPEGAAALGIVFGSRVALIGREAHNTAAFCPCIRLLCAAYTRRE